MELPTPADPDNATSIAAAGRFGSPLSERTNSLITVYTMNWELDGSSACDVVEGMGDLGEGDDVTERE